MTDRKWPPEPLTLGDGVDPIVGAAFNKLLRDRAELLAALKKCGEWVYCSDYTPLSRGVRGCVSVRRDDPCDCGAESLSKEIGSALARAEAPNE